VQWHFDRHACAGFNTLEVNVQNLLLEGVHLQVTQQNFVLCTVQFHTEDGGVKGFFFDRMEQSVVIDFDQQRLTSSTINNTGRTTGDAETAARTRALQRARKSDKFHNQLQKEACRDQLASNKGDFISITYKKAGGQDP
jgi:hypothetical protein